LGKICFKTGSRNFKNYILRKELMGIFTKIISAGAAAGFLVKKRFKITGLILNSVANKIYRNHPSMAERLQPIINSSFFVKITNLPFNVFFTIEEKGVAVKALHNSEQPTADLTISSDLTSLVNIFEGDEDGDKLFFSRKLQINGNSEALVTLRNAIDSQDINIVEEISAPFKIFANPAKSVINKLKRHVC